MKQNINNISQEDKVKLTNLFAKLNNYTIGEPNYRVDSKYDFITNNTVWDFRSFCGGYFQNKTTEDLDNIQNLRRENNTLLDMTVDPFINKTINKYKIPLNRKPNGWYVDYRAHKMYRHFLHGYLLY